MLSRIRIEVTDEDSAAATEEALTKYEYAAQAIEADRHGLFGAGLAPPAAGTHWGGESELAMQQLAEKLGREVTDEVIEYDASIPGYKGRRVVCFRRIDTRAKLDETGHRPGEREAAQLST